MEHDVIKKFKERREQRLLDRRKDDVLEYKWRRVARLLSRFDAEGDEENNENGEKKGGHGNTRLPYGLCARFGITVESGWTPHDCWEALAGKGITPEGAFARLKRGEDPGAPTEGGEEGASSETVKTEPAREPKKSVEWRGKKYDLLTIMSRKWDSGTPYSLYCQSSADGSWGGYRYIYFPSKGDLLYLLKEQGVEEIADPDTGEILNPAEMELPPYDFVLTTDEGVERHLSNPAIGLYGGLYKVTAVTMDGKKVTVSSYRTLKDAKSVLAGVEDSKIRISPAVKKREAERSAWKTSSGKESIEIDGKIYGDLHAVHDRTGMFQLMMETAEGELKSSWFHGKNELIAYLKEQGVDKAKIDKEVINPQEVELPETLFKAKDSGYLGGEYRYVKAELKKLWYGDNSYVVMGTTIDGEEREIGRVFDDYESVKRVESKMGGLKLENIDMNDETRAALEKSTKSWQEREIRAREFEAKKERFGMYEYADIHVTKTKSSYRPDTYYCIMGYDESGKEVRISAVRSIKGLLDEFEHNGKNPENYIKDTDIRKEYDDYQDMMKEFYATAKPVGDILYAKLEMSVADDKFYIMGTDSTGNRRTLYSGYSYDKMREWLDEKKLKTTDMTQTEEAVEGIEKAKKRDELVKTGKFFKYGAYDDDDDDRVYSDIKIVPEFGKDHILNEYLIMGRDPDGNEKDIDSVSTIDDAIEKLMLKGVTDYKRITEDGQEVGMPTNGMHKVRIAKLIDGGFKVEATLSDGTRKTVYSSDNVKDCRKWLADNNVDSRSIKTRAMHPGDDVPRIGYTKSLYKFDEHRYEMDEKHHVYKKMSDDEKIEAQAMVKDMFSKYAYRMWAGCDVFESIFDKGFLNQLESGHSGGAFGAGTRTGIEHKMFDTPVSFSDVAKGEREKYGYLGRDDDRMAVMHDPASGYTGGKDWSAQAVCFKFKKDVVEEKTTYTFGDSLNIGAECAGYAGKNPTYEGIDPGENRGRGPRYKERLQLYRDWKSGQLNDEEFYSEVCDTCNANYIEVQYHIKNMTMLDNVETITFENTRGITQAFGRMTQDKRRTVLQALKDRGITISYLDSSTLMDGYDFLKDYYKM